MDFARTTADRRANKIGTELVPRAALVVSARGRARARARACALEQKWQIRRFPYYPRLPPYPTVYRHRGIFVGALRMRPRRSFSICSSPLRAGIALLLSSYFASFVPVQRSSSGGSSSSSSSSSSTATAAAVAIDVI